MTSLGMKCTEEELAKLVAEVDIDCDGLVSFPEFMLLMLEKME